jgi:hypothetical protein
MYPNGKSRISPEEFARRYPSALERGKLALRLIEEANRQQSADDLQAAIVIGATFGFSAEHIPVLCQLLHVVWHSCHEDIVSTLQQLKDPRALDAIYRAASVKHEYLAYDEFFGLARKCTWALADIGTVDTLAKLHLLAASDNSLIAGYAQERIDNWGAEQKKKEGQLKHRCKASPDSWQRKNLFPLNRPRRLARDVEDAAIHALHFIDDAAREFLQQVIRQFHPVRRHAVL